MPFGIRPALPIDGRARRPNRGKLACMPQLSAPEETVQTIDPPAARAHRVAAPLAVDEPPPAAGAKRRVWPWIVVVAIVGAGAYLFFPRATVGQATTTATATRPAQAGVPVVTATARRGSMGVYLSGLGTVTPLNTVTVHTRVDGELVEVAFTEGQIVQK